MDIGRSGASHQIPRLRCESSFSSNRKAARGFQQSQSALNDEELEETLHTRAEKFREVEGLVQKFYLRDRGSDRVGGFYIFDSEDSRDAFLDSELRATIGEAYAVKGKPDVSLFELLFPLRESEEFPNPA